jgi:hypothetical protein
MTDILVPANHVKMAAEYLREATTWCERIRREYGKNELTMNNNAGIWNTLADELEQMYVND